MLSISGPSLHLGTFARIPIKVHWSFVLLLLFVGYIASSNEIPKEDLIWFFSYVFLLFVFVIMHEYGHALTARRYGIKTRDIIISPIGGIARLERLPENPRHELLVALAGPAVNVVLAIFFLLVQLVTSDFILPNAERINFGSPHEFIGYLLIINIVLVVFNLVPAFPMDGGRVLRSVLTMITKNRLSATRWAVWIGQLIATGFFMAGLIYDQYMLMFIGIFVFLTARAEYRQIRLSHRMSHTLVGDIMRREFTVLNTNQTISNAADIEGESNFLVSDENDVIVGTLPDLFISDAIKNKQSEMLIGERMVPFVGSILENHTLQTAFRILNDSGWSIATVVDVQGNKKGVIDRQLLLDFIRTA